MELVHVGMGRSTDNHLIDKTIDQRPFVRPGQSTDRDNRPTGQSTNN